MADKSDPVKIADGLRRAFDHMIQDARGELHEHEQHVAEVKARIERLIHLRAVMDVIPLPETMQ